MAEYIEREFALNVVKRTSGDYAAAFVEIAHAPVADVAPVVRCQECKNAYINAFSAASGVLICLLFTNRADGVRMVMQADDFCSYGERRDT